MKRAHRVGSAGPAGEEPPAPAAPATRARRSGWRDPKLALGLLLIGLSMALGATIVGRADDTVGVWALAHDVPAGAPLSADDLVSRQVRLPSSSLARFYLASTDPPVTGVVAVHALIQDELLARSALVQEQARSMIEVPLQVGPGALPPSIEVGTAVDIWVIAGPGSDGAGARASGRAKRIVEAATLLHLADRADALSAGTDREILIGVPQEREDSVGELLGALQDGRVVVTRRS